MPVEKSTEKKRTTRSSKKSTATTASLLETPSAPPSTLIFTEDYQELQSGSPLSPGCSLTIAYKPERIVPTGTSYHLGDPDYPILAYIQFSDSALAQEIRLEAAEGVLSPTPELSSVLKGQITVPADAKEAILWFTLSTGG